MSTIRVKIPVYVNIEVDEPQISSEEVARRVNEVLQELAGSNDGSEFLANIRVKAETILSLSFL